ncbi:MAG: hypothetical protein K2P63_00010 [Lachnospiraceae bacterium]|nr:hypothetical protein [Lachnospiraceae bacterium]
MPITNITQPEILQVVQNISLRKFDDNLAHHGKLYIIEVKAAKETADTPIGDVTFWQQDMLVQRILSNWHLDLPDCSAAKDS